MKTSNCIQELTLTEKNYFRNYFNIKKSKLVFAPEIKTGKVRNPIQFQEKRNSEEKLPHTFINYGFSAMHDLVA